MQLQWLLCVVGAYLCGSIPFGWLIGRAHGVDIRRIGSGNIGATNCGRILGRKWGILCTALDALKGFVPVALAGCLLGYLGDAELPASDAWRWLVVALGAVLGHMFPVWLGFRGGKGVATGLGVMLGLYPAMTIPALGAAATWTIVALGTRYIGLASVAAAGALPLFVALWTALSGAAWRGRLPFLVVFGVMGLLVIYRHRGNLARMARGTEPKWGAPRGASEDKSHMDNPAA